MPQYDLNLRDYWRILRKRRWSVALVTAAFGLLPCCSPRCSDPIRSTRRPRWSSSSGPRRSWACWWRRSRCPRAMRRPPRRPYPELPRPRAGGEGTAPDPGDARLRGHQTESRHVQLLGDLRNRVTATPEENTTLINVTVTSRDPARPPGSPTPWRRRTRRRTRRSATGRSWRRDASSRSIREVDNRVRQAEDRIRTLKETRGFVSLTEETTASVARLGVLEGGGRKDPPRQDEIARPDPDRADNRLRAAPVPRASARRGWGPRHRQAERRTGGHEPGAGESPGDPHTATPPDPRPGCAHGQHPGEPGGARPDRGGRPSSVSSGSRTRFWRERAGEVCSGRSSAVRQEQRALPDLTRQICATPARAHPE